MKDIAIGQIVSYDNTTLIVVGSPYNRAECKGCFFSEWERRKRHLPKISCYMHRLACTAHQRKDRHHVIFKELS